MDIRTYTWQILLSFLSDRISVCPHQLHQYLAKGTHQTLHIWGVSIDVVITLFSLQPNYYIFMVKVIVLSLFYVMPTWLLVTNINLYHICMFLLIDRRFLFKQTEKYSCAWLWKFNNKIFPVTLIYKIITSFHYIIYLRALRCSLNTLASTTRRNPCIPQGWMCRV